MNLFLCPICSSGLIQQDNILRCPDNHSFDISREGYINLLPSHHRSSKKPGDDSAMVNARRRFLEAGFYKPLADEILTSLKNMHGNADDGLNSLADLGCGEGYFTSVMSEQIQNCYGVDISKPAIRLAARRYKNISFAIANTLNIPVAPSSFDVATIILAPMTEDVARILKPGGILMRVSPGAAHLVEVKERLYREARQHERAELNLPDFTHMTAREVTFEMKLETAAQQDLIAMTPMAHRSKATLRELMKSQGDMLVKADFWIDFFRRTDPDIDAI